MKSKLKIAIQKSGRLNEESLKLLNQCGIKIFKYGGKLKVSSPDFPVEFFYLRNSDIPFYLEDGIVDAAIIGENILKEKRANVQIIESLGFAKCRVSLALPVGSMIGNLSDYNNKRIATSYPNTLSQYLEENKLNAEIHTISGSVEIAPNIGLADAVCDIISTGSTLKENGLIEDKILFYSEAVLATSNKIKENIANILDELLFRIRAVNRAKNKRYILMNVPNNKVSSIINLLPVLKSPTVMPLSDSDWSSIHSVIDGENFWSIINLLKQEGAEDILILPIEKIVR